MSIPSCINYYGLDPTPHFNLNTLNQHDAPKSILIAEKIRYDTIRYDTIRYDTLRYVTLRYVTLRYNTLRYVTLRYVTLRYVTLRYVTLRYVTLRCTSKAPNSSWIRAHQKGLSEFD